MAASRDEICRQIAIYALYRTMTSDDTLGLYNDYADSDSQIGPWTPERLAAAWQAADRIIDTALDMREFGSFGRAVQNGYECLKLASLTTMCLNAEYLTGGSEGRDLYDSLSKAYQQCCVSQKTLLVDETGVAPKPVRDHFRVHHKDMGENQITNVRQMLWLSDGESDPINRVQPESIFGAGFFWDLTSRILEKGDASICWNPKDGGLSDDPIAAGLLVRGFDDVALAPIMYGDALDGVEVGDCDKEFGCRDEATINALVAIAALPGINSEGVNLLLEFVRYDRAA